MKPGQNMEKWSLLSIHAVYQGCWVCPRRKAWGLAA